MDTAQELLLKQLFIAIQVCSIKRWSPQHTHVPGATRLKSTLLHAPQPDECTCCYRCHEYCWTNVHRKQMWTVGVGPCTETTSCYPQLSCLACFSICRRCGWPARLQRRVPLNDCRCVNYRSSACDVHSCTISFDLRAPRYRFKTSIYSSQKSADSDSDELWKSLRIQIIGCELGIRNNTI